MNSQPSSPLERIRDTGVIAILRGIDGGATDPVVDALLAGDVIAIEVTANSEGALEQIRRQRERVGGQGTVGVGTVLDVGTAEAAIDAGAAFVVTPAVEPAVIEYCMTVDVPIVAGAYTPTEALTAVDAGADLVKVFPASTGGPDHVRAFQGPLDHLPLVPTGGVTPETAGAYIQSGAVAVGMGSGLVPDAAVDSGAYDEITERARATRAAVDDVR